MRDAAGQRTTFSELSLAGGMAFLAGATDVYGLERLRDLFVSFMSGNTTMRPLIAPDASGRRGNSFDIRCKRTGNLPLHCSRYFRFTVSVSSPLIESRPKIPSSRICIQDQNSFGSPYAVRTSDTDAR